MLDEYAKPREPNFISVCKEHIIRITKHNFEKAKSNRGCLRTNIHAQSQKSFSIFEEDGLEDEYGYIPKLKIRLYIIDHYRPCRALVSD